MQGLPLPPNITVHECAALRPDRSTLGQWVKLKGAAASLFRNVFDSYLDMVNDECNATPDEVPLFSWLSPHQRVALVSELAVGLLCPNEPLPPHTPQHRAAWFAMQFFLESQITVEVESAEIDSEDLMEPESDPAPPQYSGAAKFEPDFTRSWAKSQYAQTKEHQKAAKSAAKGDTAGLEKEFFGGVPAKGGRSEEGVDFRLLQRFLQRQVETGVIRYVPYKQPPQAPTRKLTEDEAFCFYWRRGLWEVVEEYELQPTYTWRCIDLDKWSRLIDTLLMKLMNPSNDEHLLHRSMIRLGASQDRKERARHTLLIKLATDVRAQFEKDYSLDSVVKAQRKLFIFSDQRPGRKVAEALEKDANNPDSTERHGLSFAKEALHWLPAYYKILDESRAGEKGQRRERSVEQECQERYNALKAIGQKPPYNLIGGKYTYEKRSPDKWMPHDWTIYCAACHETKPMSFVDKKPKKDKEVLRFKRCGGCRVLWYCSRKCQKNDWKKHKQECKEWSAKYEPSSDRKTE